MMKYGFSMGCAAVLMSGVSLSPATAQTLQEVLELTYATNPSLRAERAQLRATDETGAQARAGWRPTLNGRVTYEAADGTFEPGDGLDLGGLFPGGEPPPELFDSLTGNGGAGTTQAGLELRQPLFQGGRVINAVRSADAQIDAAQAQLVATEQALFYDVIDAYLGVRVAEERVELTQTSQQLLTRQREQAQALFDAGSATRTDIAQAGARAAEAEAELIRARSDLMTARTAFERITGRMPGTLEERPPLPALPATMDAALDLAMDFNPQIVIAREQAEAADYRVRQAKGALAPTIEAKATYGYAENQFIDGDRSENVTLGAEITVPLFQGGSTWSGIREARETRSAARYRLIDTEREIRRQVQTAWQQVIAAEAAYEATAPALEAAGLAYEGLTLESSLGQRSTLEVLDGEQNLFRVQLSRLQALQAYYLASYRLLQATGQLTAEGLGLGVDYYDPDLNREDVTHRWIGAGTEFE